MALPWILLAVVLASMLSLILWALVRQNRTMTELLALEDRGLFFQGAWRMMQEFPGPFRGKAGGEDDPDGPPGRRRRGRRPKAPMPEFSEKECVRQFRQHYLSGVRRYVRAVVLIILTSTLLPAAFLFVRESGRRLLWGTTTHLFVTICIAVFILALIVSIVSKLRLATELIFKVEGKMALLLDSTISGSPKSSHRNNRPGEPVA